MNCCKTLSKHCKLIIPVIVMTGVFVFGGCAAKPVGSPQAAVTKEPTNTLLMTQAPAFSTNEQVPAVTDESAPASGISPDVELFLQNYSYEEVAPYNVFFTESTTADMDGDGSDETVTIEGTKRNKAGGNEYYTSLKVKSGTDELSLQADPGWSFGPADSELSGTVLDLDKDDGKKELLIEATSGLGEDDAETTVKYLLITYTDFIPKVLATLDYLPEATGTGFIKSIQYSKKLAGDYSIAIQSYERYQPDNGFQKINVETVRALSYTSVPPERGGGYLTNWNQMVAKNAGEETDIALRKGTEVYFGLFHTKGWIELHDAEGATLGWLDLNRVNVDQYIGYAVPYSCH